MGAPIVNTAQGYASIEQKRIKVDMSETIARLEPSATPLIVLTKKINTSPVHNPHYEFMDHDLEQRWIKAAADATNTDTAITFETGQGANVTVGDLLKHVVSGEVMRVISIAGDVVTVERNVGNALAVAGTITTGDSVLVMGNSAMQGSGAPAENVVGVTPFDNYTQIFKTAFSVTNTLEATSLYGETELARLRKNAGIRHAKSMEYAYLFGVKSYEAGGAQPITTTEGIYTSLVKDGTNLGVTGAAIDYNTFTQEQLMEWSEALFYYGSNERTCLCSPDILSWFANKANEKVTFIQSDMDKTFGLNITRYVTPHGYFNLVLHPLLVQGYTGTMIALDMKDVAHRPLRGRDTTLKTNVQLDDEDGQRDMYITESGVQIRLRPKHGILKLTRS